jgi:RNA polymerase II elongation factor ELL
MRPLKEASPHELYLRLASATKPMAALRLHADVIGKFTVERELGTKVQDRVRDRTLVAEKQRLERKAILLDNPPSDLSSTANGKKRKASAPSQTMFRNAVKSRNDLPSSSSVSSSKPSSSTAPSGQPPPSSAKGLRDLHNRLIHCLALSPREPGEVIRLVAGANASPSSKRELQDILHEVRPRTLIQFS